MVDGVRGVLLDFYGTVVHDDDVVVHDIARQVADDTGEPAETVGAHWWRAFRAQSEQAHGENFRLQSVLARTSLVTVLRAVGSHLDVDQLLAPQLAHWAAPRAYEDAVRFLAEARLPVVILSDTDDCYLDSALASLGLAELPYVTSELARAYKPRPKGFLLGLARLGLPAHDVVHVGDSWSSDVRGAEAAGVRPVWVDRGMRSQPRGLPRPVRQISGLDGLEACIIG